VTSAQTRQADLELQTNDGSVVPETLRWSRQPMSLPLVRRAVMPYQHGDQR
jgi:hypothetical protein